jgi:DNA-binding NtrC family response regulator/tetratricopeptide (TPR) repeat protein
MAISYPEAERLFNAGEFSELIRVSEFGVATARNVESRTRILLTHALVMIGRLAAARELVALDSTAGTHIAIRSRAAAILGLIDQAEGNMDSAASHFQTSIRLARESRDLERIAWAHLHLLRLFIDAHRPQSALTVLPEVRKVVTTAGLPHLSAYLHLCVSSLEGQAGRLNEALRHCEIAESIFGIAPNSWLQGIALLIRACVGFAMCEYSRASECIEKAKQTIARIGHDRISSALDSLLGHTETMAGRFQKARQAFKKVVNSPQGGALELVGAYEGLARLHLTLNELDECEAALERVDEEASRHPGLGSSYHSRWAVVTRARLLLKRGKPHAALEHLRNTDQTGAEVAFLPSTTAIHLVAAEAHVMIQQFAAAAEHVTAANIAGGFVFREFQAQSYYAASLAARAANVRFATHLRQRAIRLSSYQGAVAVRMQIEADPQPDEVGSDPVASIAEIVTDSLAASIDLAYSPRLLGGELLSVIKELECSPHARVVETAADVPQSTPRELSLQLGIERRKTLTLVCTVPNEPDKILLLTNVLRIGRAAIALERARQEERNRAAVWPASPAEEQGGLLFVSEEMQALLATARRIAPTGVPVLITGETGTGKEVLARMIHAYSPRSEKPFLPFNCSATPKEMLDSQLFGHRRGSFTGALENFSGIIRAAAGGTLFLDEIGETTLDVQPKLLRFLEAGEVHPIGETQPIKVDVRVIAATNADLETLLANGRFREDLFYRLNIVRLHVPPLRERRVEIPALAHHYLQRHGQECGKGDLRLSEETMEYLVLYRWPGNVRQLANEMRRLAALAEPGAVLMPEHLSSEIAASRRTIPASQRMLDSNELVVRLDQPMAAAVQHLERAMVQYALNRCKGRMEETATMLGLSRKGLYLKRQRFGLEPPGNRPAEVA